VELSSCQIAARIDDPGLRQPERTATTALVGILATALLLLSVIGATLTQPTGRPQPAPAPIAAPAGRMADFPVQSHIASCSVLANTSNALVAPRSTRALTEVGPLYEQACGA